MRQPVRLRIRQWPEQQRIDDAKNRRIGSDPDGQRSCHHHGEHRVLAKHPQRVAKILQPNVHRPSRLSVIVRRAPRLPPEKDFRWYSASGAPAPAWWWPDLGQRKLKIMSIDLNRRL